MRWDVNCKFNTLKQIKLLSEHIPKIVSMWDKYSFDSELSMHAYPKKCNGSCSDFIIPISLQPNVVHFSYIKPWFLIKYSKF